VLLEQLLINLLENAARHTDASVPIGIKAVRAGKEVIIEIADRGAGLPPGEEQKVFEKFHRGRAEHTAGVGLGLTICRAIADAHGGRVWAENRDGGGASFKVALPLDRPAPASNPIETEAEAMSP
jgi:two-component system sensor histidine kinase KdpD